ncbi:MAG: exodeoxyribonuclease V subunit beta [Pseudomonas sp.]|jgi:exodeoxyribonuclease V beta subunit|nr:exodeoxyribonuclease V subunit beta [Pseudomonas sp.]MDY0413740.1 exodeoxyribonuclease V subunit beta [Pseudomonas sp.]NLO53397.1 exodeoxyribonuclease V subunit beta [Gammaproteobacteria bacterium]
MSLSNTTLRPLALQFPLHGSRLIEASAGTGKTYTIAALYVRLILQHGLADNAAFSRHLLPPEILVVTFTDAATQELRDRIRARLVEAAQVFRQEQDQPDRLLHRLREEYPQEQWAACAQRLDQAALWMDEAAVSTIHAWCQRMLREHAFDSGSLFTQTLETDHSDLLALVVKDYWRQQCYPLHATHMLWVLEHWQQPAFLQGKISPLLNTQTPAPPQVEQGLAQLLDKGLSAQAQNLAELKAQWPQWTQELRAILDRAVAAKAVNGRVIQSRFYTPWLDKLKAWAEDPEQIKLEIGTGFTRLTPDGLHQAWKDSSAAPQHPALEAMRYLPGHLDTLTRALDEQALWHAAHWIKQRFHREKQQRAEMGFDDMLTRLDQALQGPSGERLAEVIRQQFPIAMIDEFQDTDPLQYRIFDSIYRIADNSSETGLFLIGDPKQAIYSFRGADIHTYLYARRATEGRHYNLQTNFRSTESMVSAVNQLFSLAEQRQVGQGAFLFKQANSNDLPFLPVQAQGRAERWWVEGEFQPALTLWHLAADEPVSRNHYQEEMAASSATEIARLLNLAADHKAGFKSADGQLQALQPNDIAVLVRNMAEAQAIRKQLALRHVRSVYLSDKDSVFASQEAQDIMAWLQACLQPDNERALKSALACSTFALPLSELERINQDELLWEQRVLQFKDYLERWHKQGVLPMLRKIMHDFELPQRLVQRADGERALTNVLHLSELLQHAARELDGEFAVLRYLQTACAGQVEGAQEQILRLESDESLVRVITIHKSKGLEYPLVFLPFICGFRAQDGKQPFTIQIDGQRSLMLHADKNSLAQAEQERLAEDLRLLYVALTRARHACWLGMADLKKGQGKTSVLHHSAMGYLLNNGQPLNSSSALAEWLAPFAQADQAPSALVSHVCMLPESTANRVEDRTGAFTAKWRIAQRRTREHWWIASYSALRFTAQAPDTDLQSKERVEDLAPQSAFAQNISDNERYDTDLAAIHQPVQQGIHSFPRGAKPGTFLHGLLEWAAEQGFAEVLKEPEQAQQFIQARCEAYGFEQYAALLWPWLSHYLQQPFLIGEQPMVLAELTQYQAEMEFWFATHQANTLQMDQLIAEFVLPGAARPYLQPERLNGMFKGFIDLVLEHQGRYYVIDYKSNWLGASEADYSTAAMDERVLSHRYDLQYTLYILALHRLLKLRISDYDYDTHMGGAVYMFLRGAQSDSQGLHHARPARALIERLDALFKDSTQEAQQ